MRVRGEGSLWQRADGRWVASVQVGGKRYSVYAKSRADAAARLRTLQQQQAQGTLVAPSRLTVADYLERWLDSVQVTRKPTTVNCYRKVVRGHLVPALGAVKLQRLSPLHLIKLYETKAQAGIPGRRVSLMHEVLHAALADAVRSGLTARNVAEAVPRPRRVTQEPAVWSLEQTQQFVTTAQASTLRYSPAIVVLLALGLRASELLGLRWESVDLERGQVVVDRALTWAGHHAVWGNPKSKAGRRVLPLPAPARQALVALRRQQALDRLRAGSEWKDADNRVVATRTGGVPMLNRLKKTIASLCRTANVPRLTVHQLRHQCASLLFAAGADVKQVQHFLGHSRASVTLDVYTHLLIGSDPEMANRLEGMLD